MTRLKDILLWNFMAGVIVLAQARPNLKMKSSSGLRSVCAGNLMRLSLDKALAVGNQLEVDAINGSQHIAITPSLAAQCGYSMESDPWGNTRIYTSLMGCFVDNKEDTTFDVALRLRLYNQSPSDVTSHDVRKTCSYSGWASREILCDRNFMEVSIQMALPEAAEAKGQTREVKDDSQFNAVPQESGTGHGIWKMTFFTPEPVTMVQREATQAGYSAMTTSSRVVVRSPYNTPEAYHEDVAGVPMEVFKVTAYYKTPQGLSVANMAAACPTGGVLFTEDVISWYVPRRITPLVEGGFQIIEMYMGINGQRLEESHMAAQGYRLSQTDSHIAIEIPVGSPDGYYKSHAPDYQYHITYSVEPMLELLWRSAQHDDTRYKVLFPIMTPVMPRPPFHVDYTDLENRLFIVDVGLFLLDVELQNITFSTGVLTIKECTARGFVVQEEIFMNGSKSFSLEVPFGADVVLKYNPDKLVTNYFLPLIFGFTIQPEQTTFAYAVDLEASLPDVVLPTIDGNCDQNNFYVTVKYGNQGHNFQTLVGYEELNPDTSNAYNLNNNGTHFSIVVPHRAKDVAFEVITTNALRARLDVLLWEPNYNWVLADLFLACNFPFASTICYPNGTMTAVAVKVESVRNLVPGMLTTKDRSCKPVSSDDRFAQFTFSVDSCGTTRTFFDQYMLYENEVGLYYDTPQHHSSPKGVANTSPVEPEYRQAISCFYMVNETQTLSFNPEPLNKQPAAEVGQGQLRVEMRLSEDSYYDLFYRLEDYPVTKYLRQPLYFEVELTHSVDPSLELLLDNCWATLHEDRTSLPSWDIIVDGCGNQDDSYVTTFHPAMNDVRVAIPSHFKRFSMKMFTFTKDEEVLKDEIYVHCDALICDMSSDGGCRGRCDQTGMDNSDFQGTKRGKRSTDSSSHRRISTGPIRLLNSVLDH